MSQSLRSPPSDLPAATVLAFDASSAWCSVALLHRGRLVSLAERIGQGHSRLLLPMAQSLLAQGGLALADCDAFAFGAGPGAFTGLRIACGTAQGLGFAMQRPVVPIDAVAAVATHARRLAGQAGLAGPADVVAVALDARMGQVYFGVDRTGAGARAPDGADPIAVADPPEAANRLALALGLRGVRADAAAAVDAVSAVDAGCAAGAASGAAAAPPAWLCAGDGYARHGDALAALTVGARAVLPEAFGSAEAVALRAADRLREPGAAFAASAAAPRYVRDKVALDVHEQRLLRQERRIR